MLAGCVPATPKLYCNSFDYTESMFSYLKDEPSLDKQVAQMTDYFSYCENNNAIPAPGAYAHMGLLLTKMGNTVQANEYFNKEKKQFPESTRYMDFIMKQPTKE